MQLSGPSSRLFPVSAVWAFVPVYALHLLDERFWGMGTAHFASTYTPFWFTNSAWLWVNVPSFVLLTLAVALIVRGVFPEWAVVALAVHLLLHAIVRIGGSGFFAVVSPGVVSGVVLCVPLGVWSLMRGARALSRRELRAGLIAGVLSFQPLWHGVVFPFLPDRPPAC